MKKYALLFIATVYVVSWDKGVEYKTVPCIKEPEGITCVKPEMMRMSKTFQTKPAAMEFLKVMSDMKAPNPSMSEQKEKQTK